MCKNYCGKRRKLLVLSNFFFSYSVFKRHCRRFISSSPNPISPIPISPEFFPFRPFSFRPFSFRPFPIPPNICPALLPVRPISFSPIFHFAQKPSRPTYPFRPMTISPISHKAPPISLKCHFSDIWAQN